MMTKQLLNPADTCTLEALEEINAVLSIEALSVGSIATAVRRAVPTLVDAATGFLAKFIDRETKMFGIETNMAKMSAMPEGKIAFGVYRTFVDTMEKHKYMDISPLRFYVTEGFQGNLLSYANVLTATLEHGNKIVADVLNPFAMFISKIISNKDAAMRTTRDLAFMAKSDAVREGLTREISAFFDMSSTNGKSTVGKVVQRNADWKPLFKALDDVREASTMLKPEVVQKSIKDIVSLLNTLKAAAAAGELDNASPETLKQLSVATLTCAHEAEFYSMAMFRAFTLATVMAQNVNDIPAMINKK